MRIITLFLILFIVYSCDKNYKKNEKDAGSIEIIIGDQKSELDIFLGNESFKNDEAKRLNNLGIKFIKENQYKKAEEYFIAAYRLEPDNPTILNNLGNIYRKIGTKRMALEYYNESFAFSDSTYFNAAYNMGITYNYMEEYEKSKEILEFIISQTKDDNEKIFAKYEIVRAYVNQNKCSNAKNLYNEIKSDLNKFPEFNENRRKLEKRMENCVQHQL
jgi:tetratricopeptide (TPR) repeat protein